MNTTRLHHTNIKASIKASVIKLSSALSLALFVSPMQSASAYPDDFLKWKEQTLTNYQQYKDERDQAFTDFLKKQWKEVDTEQGVVRDDSPKPTDMPIAKPKPVVVKDLPVVKIPKAKPVTIPKPVQVATPQPMPTATPEPLITPKPAPEQPWAQMPDFDQPIFQAPKPDFDQAGSQKPIFEHPDFDQITQPMPDFDTPVPSLTDKPMIDKPVAVKPPVVTEPLVITKPPVTKPIPEPIQKPITKPITKPSIPAPSAPPVIAPPVITKPIADKPITTQPTVKPPVQTVPPVIIPTKPAPKQYSGKKYRFDFFGRDTVVFADQKLSATLNNTYNGKTIAKGWSDLSLSDYEPVLEQLETISNNHNLGDWGKVQLVFAFAKAMHPNNVNSQSFTSWFLLVKQDYQARLAYNSNGVYLLVPAEQSLYEVTFFTFGGKRFYAVSPDGKSRNLGSVFTYNGEYPRAIEPVDMKDPLAFGNESNYQQRTFDFSFKRKKYNLSLNVNPTRVSYLASYPQMDIDQYFISPVDMVTANDALDHFRPLLEGKSELEAVNMILRFVQTGFEYQTDDQQFGFENYLFAEETLTMPASDCEDRSVLFAWLVRELLGLEVVGLDYPGHIAAAVAFSKPVPGDTIAWQGKTFTVTDPTYINANAGMTMPEVANHQPKVVAIP